MFKSYIFEFLSDTGAQVVAQLDPGSYTIGREEGEASLVLPLSSISRQHAILTSCESFWLFQDIGSTNGSWINGVKLVPDKWYLLRSCDTLQLAEYTFRISELNAKNAEPIPFHLSDQNGRKLVVLRNGLFVSEFKVPEYGKALVIGGASSDLNLEGELYENPSLVIERRGNDVVVYSVLKEFPISVNGKDIDGATVINDCDEIKLLNYTILYSAVSATVVNTAGKQVVSNVSQVASNLKDWSSDNNISYDDKATTVSGQFSQFGNVSSDSDENFDVAQQHIRRQTEDSTVSFEGKIVLIVCSVIILALLILMIIWLALDS